MILADGEDADVTIHATNEVLDWSFEDLVHEVYCDFRDVFSQDGFDTLPPWKPWDHAIELTPGSAIP